MATRCDILLEEIDFDINGGNYNSDWISTANVASIVVIGSQSDVKYGVYLEESINDEDSYWPERRIPSGLAIQPIYLASQYFRIHAKRLDLQRHEPHLISLTVRRVS